KQLTKSAFLTQENTLLRMESKRYDELRAYMDANRAMRHDFRQHLLVISQYVRQGQMKELQSYLQPLVDQAGQSPMRLCANPAVDALASHYSRLALKQNAQVIWRLDLPEKLPLPDNDYCAMLGNLVENALNAMTALPQDERKAQVISRMLSDTMLGLTVDNPHRGTVLLGKNGLPKAKLTHHGVGLESVENTVNRYHGTLNIKTGNQVFSVEILLYCNNEEAEDTAKDFFK
ncbi:MAG: GHKL domain-containing protein, partial [Clostridia bacterium]|nr:GHKL domain-containing protein [Clostridia bacterium]